MWFTDTPWPPILILSVIGVLLFLGWLSQRKTGYLTGVALCVVLCGFVFVLEQQIVTEQERVEQRLLDFTATFQRDSLQRGVINAVLGGPEPESFKFLMRDADDVRRMAARALDFVDIQDDVRISDIRTHMSNKNSRATTQFRASASVTVSGYNAVRQPSRWELTWGKEDDEWKVIRATRLNFMSGKPLDDPLAMRE
ncbi:MAG: hypothetical protein IAG10_07100 [Planctomycetaceae bacterium]|nr:hypothetical protein [Planctomycetaceae bacterium]